MCKLPCYIKFQIYSFWSWHQMSRILSNLPFRSQNYLFCFQSMIMWRYFIAFNLWNCQVWQTTWNCPLSKENVYSSVVKAIGGRINPQKFSVKVLAVVIEFYLPNPTKLHSMVIPNQVRISFSQWFHVQSVHGEWLH